VPVVPSDSGSARAPSTLTGSATTAAVARVEAAAIRNRRSLRMPIVVARIAVVLRFVLAYLVSALPCADSRGCRVFAHQRRQARQEPLSRVSNVRPRAEAH
jgi:hypothetical protein